MKLLKVCVILSVLCICRFGYAQTLNDIQVLQATYGAESAQMDVTEKVQSLVRSGQTNVRVSNHLFGKDPIFGKVKTLSMVFSANGVQYRTDIREGGQLSFATSTVNQMNVAPQTQATESKAAADRNAPSVAPPPPPAEQHRLAPEGVFYVMNALSIHTASGVTGLAPGTRVRMLQDKGETFSVTDGSTTFDVSTDNLTNDVDLAALVARHDAESQHAIATWIRRQDDADHQARGDYNAMLDQQQLEVDAARAAAEAAKPRPSGALDREPYNQTDAVWPYGYYHHHRHFIYTRPSSARKTTK
jgi:hypothetical protein